MRLQLLATMGTECGTSDPLRRFAVLHPLYRSTIRSFTSSDDDPLFAFEGSSIANGKDEIAALSKKRRLSPYTAEE